jgi:hypothetical protein
LPIFTKPAKSRCELVSDNERDGSASAVARPVVASVPPPASQSTPTMTVTTEPATALSLSCRLKSRDTIALDDSTVNWRTF